MRERERDYDDRDDDDDGDDELTKVRMCRKMHFGVGGSTDIGDHGHQHSQ